MTSTNYYVIVPSVGNIIGNRPNKFRVQLPRKLQFDGPGWQMGLASIIYNNSWATFGSHTQEFMTIYLENGEIRHFKIPTGTYQSTKQLEKGIHFGIIRELDRQIDFIGLENPLDEQQQPRSRVRKSINIVGSGDLQDPTAKVPTFPQSFRQQPQQQQIRPQSSQVVQQQQQQQRQQAGQRAEDNEDASRQKIRAEQKLREFNQEIAWLRDRNEWTYAQTLQEYLLKYRNEVLITSPNLQNHINAHADEFRRLYRLVEEGVRTPFGKETATELKSFAKNIKLNYNEAVGRFEVKIGDKAVDRIELTPQISYVLGFEEGRAFKDGDMAKYAPDLRGSVSHLCVYMGSGAVEEIIFGHSLSNLLQIVAVEGQNGDVIQKEFQHPLMHKIVAREIDTLDFEIRSLDGRLVNFDYGTIVLTLLFKKSIYF